ncbi:putative LigA [metagenome]|uniref:Putative LigA n=1 Tax=metagenome TaxID=256318 RepID=A0A2P2CIK7_9ZZZZ
MNPEDVRVLARSAPERWSELELVHRSDHVDVRATLRHGELHATRLDDGHRIHEVGAPPSSWSVRPLEPYATNYEWSAMLDPYELGAGVTISDVRREHLFGRPTVAFVAHAVPGYDPVCSCCPLVLSEVSQRLEHGDDWRPRPGELPDGVDLALDLAIGIVLSSRQRGGSRGQRFTNEIIRAA